MIKPFDLTTLAKHYGGKYGGNALGQQMVFSSISIDTRTIATGDLFIALKGERYDAHDYLQQAVDSGAAGLVIHADRQASLAESIDIPLWLVEDTTQALGDIARYQRSQFSYPIVAVTGSSGKTTVKGMLEAILTASVGQEAVFASRGNFNNHIGVPLSLLELTPSHRYAVIEMGASALGEIAYLTDMTKPAVAVVNNVMAAHVEGFGSVAAIADAKGEIYEGLGENGIAVINGNDEFARQWQQQNHQRKTLVFSADEQNCILDRQCIAVSAQNTKHLHKGCYSFTLVCGDQTVEITLGVLGLHNVANAVAAATCAHAIGMDIQTIAQGLQQFIGEPGRLQILPGVKGSTLLDDSYNANPGSVKAAIDVLASIGGTTVLVLGDMAELGEDSLAEHHDIGEYAAKKGIDYVLALGTDSQATIEAFQRLAITGEASHFLEVDQLILRLHNLVDSACTILIKGSRSSRMERVVQALQSNGDNNNASLAC